LWQSSPGSPESPDRAALRDARAKGFYSLLYLAQALATTDRKESLPVLVVSSDMQLVTGSEQLRIARSLLLGPSYVMSQDVPLLRCSVIDLTAGEWVTDRQVRQLATCLAAEAEIAEFENVIAYRGGYRWSPEVSPIQLDSPQDGVLPLRERGT